MFLCVIHSTEDGLMEDRNILGLYEVHVHNVVYSSFTNNWTKAVQWWNKELEAFVRILQGTNLGEICHSQWIYR